MIDQRAADYKRFRGKCKELSEAAALADKSLTVIRGHYHCPIYGKQPHWWCEKADGTIVDPSVKQFPSGGIGDYEPFNGVVECAQCGKEMEEADARFESNYAFCSCACNMRFVGL